MPEIDLTISISVILAVCAIISPIATTLINNRYQLKLKDLEYQQKEKESSFFYRRGVYEDYLRCTGKCIAHPVQQVPVDRPTSPYRQLHIGRSDRF